MPTRKSLDERIEIVVDQIKRIGDEVVDIGEHVNEEENTRTKVINAKESSYDCKVLISGTEDQDGLTLIYSYDLMDSLGRTIEASEDIYDLEDFEEASPSKAAEELINRVDSNDLERLKFELHDNISNPITISQLIEPGHDFGSEDIPLRGFMVYRHVFPSEPDYSIRDFYNTLTAVTSTGEIGKRYLENAFAIQFPDSESKEDLSLTFDPDAIF